MVATRSLGALSLLALASLALSCETDPATWSVFEAHVIAAPGDSAAQAASDALKIAFCKEFELPTCEISSSGSDEDLYIFENLGFKIPREKFASVTAWLMQQRWGQVSGASNLDLLIHPVSGCGAELDARNFSASVGQRFPYSPNHLYTDTASSRVAYNLRSPLEEQEKEWANFCSEDCQDDDNLCVEPYASGTTCSGYADITAFHMHFFYFQNNNASIYGKEDLFEAVTSEFGLSYDEICADVTGHEMSHNETCILSGPGGGWEVDGYTQDPSMGSATSFTYGCNSLYLVQHQNYTDIFAWLLYYKNSQFQDMSFDFLVHPATGCNFADHYEFAMSIGEFIPNNNYGIAAEGGWEDTETASELDRFGLAYLAANAGELPDLSSCNLATSEFNLHVLYDPSNDLAAQAKDALLDDIAAAGLGSSIEFIVDDPSSWKTVGSPFYVGQAQYAVSTDALPSLLPLVSQRTAADAALIDLVLAPSTGCPVYDYASFAMALGRAWPVNLAALAAAQAQEPASRTFPLPRSANSAKIMKEEGVAAHVPALAVGCDATPQGYVLYALSASNNAYAIAALDTFLANMSTALELTREECTEQYPSVEPAYDKLCMMQEVAAPYKVFDDVMTTNYGAVFVPEEELSSVVAYAMTRRGPVQAGYSVDLKLVPIGTGCPSEAYSQFAFISGTNWRINESPFEDDSVKAGRPHHINANRED